MQCPPEEIPLLTAIGQTLGMFCKDISPPLIGLRRGMRFTDGHVGFLISTTLFNNTFLILRSLKFTHFYCLEVAKIVFELGNLTDSMFLPLYPRSNHISMFSSPSFQSMVIFTQFCFHCKHIPVFIFLHQNYNYFCLCS